MKKYIFCIAFFCALISQGIRLQQNTPPDDGLWTGAASSMLTTSPSTFPLLDAYMHPGGTVLEGIIGFHAIATPNYSDALIGFLMIVDSALIASICVLCYVLRKNLIWPLAVLAVLCLQPIFAESLYTGMTPPSIIASLLLPLLCLVTLYIYEQQEKTKRHSFIGWSVLAGALASTRIDVGCIMVPIFLLILLMRFSFKNVVLLGIGALISFFIFDPFMWFAPIIQTQHLIAAMTGHYTGTPGMPHSLSFYSFPRTGALGAVGLGMGALFVVLNKKIKSPIDSRFLLVLIPATLLLGGIFLSAQVQAERYVMPLVFMWEVLLPVFVFSLVDRVEFSFVKTPSGQRTAQVFLKALIIVILVAPSTFIIATEIAQYGIGKWF